MKLLLVNAVDVARSIETVYPPLGLGYLASSLKRHFPEIEIKIIDRDICQTVKSFAPDAVGVSSVSQNFGRAIEIAALCKKINIPVFVGGVHITLLPESLPREFAFGVYGEAENTIVDIVRYLMNDPKMQKPQALHNIPGLVIHSDNGPKLTPPRQLISDLDSIPFPERSLLNIPMGETTYLFTSRGCPYKCAFCASTRFWDKVRWFSAEYVVAEIENVIGSYHPRAISFYDDLFVANIPRLRQIVDLIRQKGIHKKTKFGFACRANLVNDELIKILKGLDISMICMGLESGSSKTLNYLKGDNVTIEQNKKAVQLFSDAGIHIQGTFIIGSPGETEENIRETLEFIKSSKLTAFEVYILTPFPGTPVWETALKMGRVSNTMDWSKLSIDTMGADDDRITVSEIPTPRLIAIQKELFSSEKLKRRVIYVVRNSLKNPGWLVVRIVERLSRWIPERN